MPRLRYETKGSQLDNSTAVVFNYLQPLHCVLHIIMIQCMRFPTMWYVQPAKPQISLRIRAVRSSLCLSREYSMIVKLLSEHHLKFLSFKEGCTGSSESTLVKMPHCWKSHAAAHFYFYYKNDRYETKGSQLNNSTTVVYN